MEMTIPELTARIEALEASEADAKGKLELSTNDLTAAQSLADEVQAKLTAEIANSAELAAKLAAAEQATENEKTEKAAVAKELALAREQSARFGATPPAKTDAGQQTDKPTMTLAEFNALPISGRNKFMREGGKLAA